MAPGSLAYQETDGGASDIKERKVGDLLSYLFNIPEENMSSNKLSISDIALSCGETKTQADLFNERTDTHKAGVTSGIIAQSEVPDMVHLNPPQLLMHAVEEGAVQRLQPLKHQGQLVEKFHCWH